MRNILSLFVMLATLWLPGSVMAADQANQLTQAEAMLPGGETAGDLMTPIPTDVSMAVIRAVLGGDMSTSATTLPIIGDAMLVFNVIMLAIGSFIFTGVAISGVLRTGADGEALGKKWSNLWVPLRFGASTALLIPTASGFSVGQVMTMAAIAMGVGAGDSIWKAASTSAVTRMGELSAYSQRVSAADLEMASSILKNELCLINFRRHSEALSQKLGLPLVPVKYVREIDPKSGAIYWSAVDMRNLAMRLDPRIHLVMPNGNISDNYRGICGHSQDFVQTDTKTVLALAGAAVDTATVNPAASMKIASGVAAAGVIPQQRSDATGVIYPDSILAGQAPSNSGFRTNAAGAVTSITLPNTAANLINATMQKMDLSVKQAQQLGVYNAAVVLAAHAEKIAPQYTVYNIPEGEASAKDYTSKNASVVKGETDIALVHAIQEYKRAVATAVKNASSDEELTKKMIADANASGWASSGVWFYQFAHIASNIKEKLDIETEVATAEIEQSKGNPPSESVDESEKEADSAAGNPSWTRILAALTGGESASDLFWQKISFYIFDVTGLKENDPGFMQRWFGYSPTSSDHPLIQMQQSGLIMLDTGLAIKALAHAGDFATDIGAGNIISKGVNVLTGGADAAKNLLKSLLGAVHYIAILLIVVGVVKAFIIPLLPFMKVLKAVVMFFITVCEVLVATPLWIAFHMTPDGDGFASDKVQGGYGIVLEAALRPMLIVFGLLFAFLLMWPVMNLFAEMFVMATDVVGQGVGISGQSIGATLTSATAGAGVAAGAIGAATAAGATVAAPAVIVGGAAIAAGMALNYLIMKLIYLVLFVAMAYLIVDKCCDVIDILPANVMNWINIRANGQDQSMDNRVNAFMGKLESNATTLASGGGKGGKGDKDGKGKDGKGDKDLGEPSKG